MQAPAFSNLSTRNKDASHLAKYADAHRFFVDTFVNAVPTTFSSLGEYLTKLSPKTFTEFREGIAGNRYIDDRLVHDSMKKDVDAMMEDHVRYFQEFQEDLRDSFDELDNVMGPYAPDPTPIKQKAAEFIHLIETLGDTIPLTTGSNQGEDRRILYRLVQSFVESRFGWNRAAKVSFLQVVKILDRICRPKKITGGGVQTRSAAAGKPVAEKPAAGKPLPPKPPISITNTLCQRKIEFLCETNWLLLLLYFYSSRSSIQQEIMDKLEGQLLTVFHSTSQTLDTTVGEKIRQENVAYMLEEVKKQGQKDIAEKTKNQRKKSPRNGDFIGSPNSVTDSLRSLHASSQGSQTSPGSSKKSSSKKHYSS